MFTDTVEIEVVAGKGGDGLMSFLREKYRAFGGPDGGNGGRGGDVVFRVDHNLNTLSAYRTNRRINAQPGQPGKGNKSHGRGGEDVIVRVPQGTQVYDNGELIADLTADGEESIIAKGGRGGFGNAHFVSSTRQSPRAAEVGEPGERRMLRLELKLVADVGLVGLPNAGKSTLLSVISNAKPEIGDYPFTTLIPNLGVVDIDEDTVLFADIPGLIEGASQGKGLGDEFLRHVERTAVLFHLIDVTSDTIANDYITIVRELASYKVDLTDKQRLIVPTKIEAVEPHLLDDRLAEIKRAAGLDMDAPLYPISAQAHRGLDALLRTAVPLVHAARTRQAEADAESSIHVFDEASQIDLWHIESDGDILVIKGGKIEGFGRRTNWDNPDSVERLRDIMRKMGVSKELERSGAKEGSIVRIAGHDFDWL